MKFLLILVSLILLTTTSQAQKQSEIGWLNQGLAEQHR